MSSLNSNKKIVTARMTMDVANMLAVIDAKMGELKFKSTVELKTFFEESFSVN